MGLDPCVYHIIKTFVGQVAMVLRDDFMKKTHEVWLLTVDLFFVFTKYIFPYNSQDKEYLT